MRTAQKSVSSTRPVVGLNSYPTGFCMKELAARMKYADSNVPSAASQIEAEVELRGEPVPPEDPEAQERRLPRKNASRPSMASGAPKMSPTNRE